MSGGEAHVENSIWMRAVLIGGVFLAIGVLAFHGQDSMAL